MRTPHPNPRPTAPCAATPARPRRGPSFARSRPAGCSTPLLSPLLLASCTDDVTANCPPLKHPEVLTVAAAAGNPCAARKGESAPAGLRQPKDGER